MEIIKGTGVALITPFNEDLSIDYVGLEKLKIYQIEGGMNGNQILAKLKKALILTILISFGKNELPILGQDW